MAKIFAALGGAAPIVIGAAAVGGAILIAKALKNQQEAQVAAAEAQSAGMDALGGSIQDLAYSLADSVGGIGQGAGLPVDPSGLVDSNGNGIPDVFEASLNIDLDGDGIPDTPPTLFDMTDSNGNGIPDVLEVGLPPLDPTQGAGIDPYSLDTDGDGVPNVADYDPADPAIRTATDWDNLQRQLNPQDAYEEPSFLGVKGLDPITAAFIAPAAIGGVVAVGRGVRNVTIGKPVISPTTGQMTGRTKFGKFTPAPGQTQTASSFKAQQAAYEVAKGNKALAAEQRAAQAATRAQGKLASQTLAREAGIAARSEGTLARLGLRGSSATVKGAGTAARIGIRGGSAATRAIPIVGTAIGAALSAKEGFDEFKAGRGYGGNQAAAAGGGVAKGAASFGSLGIVDMKLGEGKFSLFGRRQTWLEDLSGSKQSKIRKQDAQTLKDYQGLAKNPQTRATFDKIYGGSTPGKGYTGSKDQYARDRNLWLKARKGGK